ncbi:hypothetical protein PSP6_80226 [Paraburkholderia tropica]|nr:hypothetical protein PSP6_80226 [Paraburkholderia tropica]
MPRENGLSTGTSEGNGRVHGERLCEVQRQARRLHRMSGRGAAPLLTELDEARLDHMPVLDQARHFATDPGGG